MSVRAIRGATQIDEDSSDLMRDAVVELITSILDANGLTSSDLISVLFTCTPDLVSDFPAASARAMGMGQEMAVPGSLPRTIRTLIHCSTERSQNEIAHIYLRGASVLRKDIAQ